MGARQETQEAKAEQAVVMKLRAPVLTAEKLVMWLGSVRHIGQRSLEELGQAQVPRVQQQEGRLKRESHTKMGVTPSRNGAATDGLKRGTRELEIGELPKGGRAVGPAKEKDIYPVNAHKVRVALELKDTQPSD